jgi:putative membrane protein
MSRRLAGASWVSRARVLACAAAARCCAVGAAGVSSYVADQARAAAINAASPIPNLVSCFNDLSPDRRCGGRARAASTGEFRRCGETTPRGGEPRRAGIGGKARLCKGMQFLKTLFWMVLAVSLAIFATRNWRDVTIDLWGPLAADIKLPLLMAVMVVLGWLPTWLILRSRLWHARRKLQLLERPVVAPVAPAPAPADEPVLP